MLWFLRETFKRGPAQGAVALRVDSGFYSQEGVEWGEAHQVRFSITADQRAPVRALIEAGPDSAWTNLPEDYPVSEVAAVRYRPTQWAKVYRYGVKRQLTEKKTGDLYWRYHVCVTNAEATPALALEVWQLHHAARENSPKEHKSGLGLEKVPTGRFHANWASLLLGQLAFNLGAWFKKLVLPARYHRATLKTIRHHVLHLASGANHVCLMPLRSDHGALPDERALEAFAPR